MSKSRLKNVLPLQVFIRRQQVLRLYREFNKTVRFIPDESLRIDLKRQIRADFKQNMNIKENSIVRVLMQEAQRHLVMLQSMGTSSLKLISKQSLNNKGNIEDNIDSNSWLGMDDPEDPRGRVGVKWPWDKN